MTLIPVGVINYYLMGDERGRGKISNILKNISAPKDKKIGISFGFATESNAERTELKNMLLAHPAGHLVEERKQFDYLKKMSEYSFVASPEGNGVDCHRTWEAFYLNVIPISRRKARLNPTLTSGPWCIGIGMFRPTTCPTNLPETP